MPQWYPKLTDNQVQAIRALMVPLRNLPGVNNLDLFHGTNDRVFYARICTRDGFSSDEYFMARYALHAMTHNANANYGPGLYLADTRNESANYGSLIIRLTPDLDTTLALDLHGNAGRHAVTATGVAIQDAIAEPRLYGLIKVTAHYYIARSPFNYVVGVA